MEITFILDTIYKKHNIAYNVDGFSDIGKHDEIPIKLSNKISEKVFEGTGMILAKDSSMMVDGYKVNLYKQDTLTEWVDYKYGKKWIEVGTSNSFAEDKMTRHLFSIKKLGWANIDRLFNAPRTKEIEMIVKVNNCSDYEDIYTSMIFDNKCIYIPGYQKKDKSFSFTHGDYENPSLPIGEIATIPVTAYKNEMPFFAPNRRHRLPRPLIDG